MASQEEDNKLECISNVNREQEIYCLNVYKKYDTILNSKTECFDVKVKSLIEVWKSIAELNLTDFDVRYIIQIIEWAKLHALNIVLTGEWKSAKEDSVKNLLENIEKAQNKLLNVNNAFSARCQKLADVVRNPWEDPVLTNMLHSKDAEIGAAEIEFFCMETAYLVSVRLKKLCESQCEDLALNLVTNFLNYTKLATTHNFNINATATQMWFIFDIYMALLYKFQDKQKMVQNFQELQLHEGLQLIKRFAKKRVKISKIWRNCHKIAIYGSRFFLSKTLMKYTEDLKDFLADLLKTYISLSSTDILLNEFVTSVRGITNLADAPGLCIMCEVIHREAGDKLRHFVIEMYIRALTTDMNELERLKHVKDDDKVAIVTSRLANTFSNLADLLDNHVKVSRECVLTAFSLEPTKDRLKRIEDLAERSGFQVLDTGQEWKCRLHPPMLPSDDIAWMCAECGDWMNKPELSAPVKINMALNEALQGSILGISDALCDDLVVCLSNPRYQVLSWLLPWGDLYRLCVMYLSDPEKTKNFVTELKFVDIDYSLFQHIKREPIDEYTGIEKGYEQYLDLDFVSEEEHSSISEDSVSQDKSLSLGSDGSGEPYLTQFSQPKSDPNTLKSLRMFRPNLKRKTAEPETIPEKQIKTSADNSKPCTVTSGVLYEFKPSSSLSNFLSNSASRTISNGTSSSSSQVSIKEESDSKNVVAATLLQLGGQVAMNNNKIIQVHQTSPHQNTNSPSLDMVQLLQTHTYSHTKASQPQIQNPRPSSCFSDNVDRLLSTAQLLEELTEFCTETPQQQTQIKEPAILNTTDQSLRSTSPSISTDRLNQRSPANQLVPEISHSFKPIKLVQPQIIMCQDLKASYKVGTISTQLGFQKTTTQTMEVSDVGLKEPESEIEQSDLSDEQEESIDKMPDFCKETPQDPEKNETSSIPSNMSLRELMPNQRFIPFKLLENCKNLRLIRLSDMVNSSEVKLKVPEDSLISSEEGKIQDTTPLTAVPDGIPTPPEDTCDDPDSSDQLIKCSEEDDEGFSDVQAELTCERCRNTKEIGHICSEIEDLDNFSENNNEISNQNEVETKIILPDFKEAIDNIKVEQGDTFTVEVETNELQSDSKFYNSENLEVSCLDNTLNSNSIEEDLTKNNDGETAESNHAIDLETIESNFMQLNEDTKTDCESKGNLKSNVFENGEDTNEPDLNEKDSDRKQCDDNTSDTFQNRIFQNIQRNPSKSELRRKNDPNNVPDITALDIHKDLCEYINKSIVKIKKLTKAKAPMEDIMAEVGKFSSVKRWYENQEILEYLLFKEHSYSRQEYEEFNMDDVDESCMKESMDSDIRPLTAFFCYYQDRHEDYTSNSTVTDMENVTYTEDFSEILSLESDALNLKFQNIERCQNMDNEDNDMQYPIPSIECEKEDHIFSDFEQETPIVNEEIVVDECNEHWFEALPYDEFLPKTFDAAENLRTYSNTHKNRHINVPCFRRDYIRSFRKYAYTQNNICLMCYDQHSKAKANKLNLKELKVLLSRLPANVTKKKLAEKKVKKSYSKRSPSRRCKKKKREKPDIYNHFKRSRRPKRVSPLLDINIRPTLRKRNPKKQLFRHNHHEEKPKNKKSKLKPTSLEKTSKKECRVVVEKMTKQETKRHTIDEKECKKAIQKIVRSYSRVDRQPVEVKDCKVILENIASTNNNNYAKEVLKNVPGLNDYQMIRPGNVDHIVNVVQISGGRPTSNVTSQNNQTSTQVSPHIQRIGQPRVVEPKPETSSNVNNTTGVANSSVSSLTTVTKPVTTPPSTLINILSQQIIRPNPNTARTRTAPLINILSQQIIKPGNSAIAPKNTNISTSTVNTTVTSTENHQNTTIKTEPTFTIKAEPTFCIKSEPPLTIKSSEPSPVVSSQSEILIPSEGPRILNSTIKNFTPSTATTSNPPGTILQFICKKTLPKFQQAFGKTVYQTNETPNPPSINLVETTTTNTTTPTPENKKVITSPPAKTIPVNMQPIQGNVIYRGQMPVGQTISLIPPGSTTRQLFRITGSTHEQISLVKETVIQNKMSALLAAALQGKPKVSEQNGEVVEEYSATRITLCRPNAAQTTRLVKPVQLQIPTNVIKTSPQPNVSSTTLEQLREFDMVYKQVKERSSSTTQPEVATSSVQLQTDNQDSAQQRISFTYVNQVQKYTQLSPVVVVSSYNNIQPAASPALSVTSQGSSSPCVTPASTPTLPKIASKTSKGKSIKTSTTTANNAIKPAPNIPKPQQKPQEDEHTTQRIFDILAEYAEQLRNSPDLNNKPAPRRRSNPPTNPSSNSKRKKSSSSKKSGQSNSSIEIDTEDLTMGSEDSSGGNIVQLSVTDDEQSQATSITPPESNSETSPGPRQQVILTDNSSNSQPPQNVILADTSVGEALKIPNTALVVPGSYILPVSMVKGGQQIAVVSGGSKILATVPARSGQNMLLFQSFLNQNKKGAISAVKYSAIQPVSGISSQSIAGVSAQPPVILPSNSVATAMTLGQPITLKKLDEGDRLNTELLLTIAKPREPVVKIEDSPETPQPDSSTSLSSDSIDIKEENTSHSDSSSNEKTYNTFRKMSSVATSVIASCIKEESIDDNASVNIISVAGNTDNKDDQNKPSERMQSVLVNASNGPMLSHMNARFRKQSERATNTTSANKEQFLHNGEKRNSSDQKSFKTNPAYFASRAKKNPTSANKKIDSEMQKQAAMERELRLQKSLSEECEDLGVDEPSTSDLFPEADLLFDSNHSPSYDQISHDGKKTLQHSEIKEAKSGINLFSDDENSGSLRTDIFDYVSSEFHAVESALNYQARQLMNGNNTSNESASSCEDSTLLPNCGTMSEVTLNSPISPETYSDNTQPSVNKYKYKYSNRKKGDRNKQPDKDSSVEVSSSEDTELKNSKKKDKPSNITFEEELSDENFKVVRVAITKTDVKEVKCQLHCEDNEKRGSRKSAKKPCACCTGAKTSGASGIRKRPQTPVAPQNKKTFPSKKR